MERGFGIINLKIRVGINFAIPNAETVQGFGQSDILLSVAKALN